MCVRRLPLAVPHNTLLLYNIGLNSRTEQNILQGKLWLWLSALQGSTSC